MADPLAVFYFPLLGTPTALGNQLWFYEAGTDVPLDVWTDVDGLIPWAQPIVFNAAGNPDGIIYVTPTPSQKIVYKDADDVAIPGYPVDNIVPSTILNVQTTSTVILTNAQIKALPTTAITLIAAPDIGARVKLLGATLQADFTAGAYTNVNTTFASLFLQNTAGNFLSSLIVNDSSTTTDLTQMTTLFNAAQTRVVDVPLPSMLPSDAGSTSGATGYLESVLTTTAANVDGTAVSIKINNNGSGALTGGNAANTLTCVLYYALEVV